MTRNSAFFIFLILLPISNLKAQNYYYVHGKIAQEQKGRMNNIMEKLAERYKMKNVTFAVISCPLPSKTNATTEYDYNSIVNRSMVLFRINMTLTDRDALQALVHEMVHALQFYADDLIRYDRITFAWKGEIFENIHKIPYQDRPWEIEAMQKSKLLIYELVSLNAL